MVRGGRTPLRTLVLQYGADLAYTEEIIDDKLLKAIRIENDILNTVDYIIDDDLVLRITKDEAPKCVLQVGSCSEDKLVAVCKKYSGDVAAIDVNMGCPKSFSLEGGRGAALLTKPDLVKQMITLLVNVSPIPVSCKIRVLKTLPATIEFAKMLEGCGISALGVHGRNKDERPSNTNRSEWIGEVAKALSIPVITSGESSAIKEFDDIAKTIERCGSSSIMIARTALWKPSIFRSQGLLSMEEEIQDFLEKACIFDEPYTQMKYVVQRILGGCKATEEKGRATVNAGSNLEIYRIWGKEELYNEYQEKFNRVTHKRRISGEENGVYTTELTFPPKRLKKSSGLDTPKSILAQYCYERRMNKPIYESTKRETDGRFTSIVIIDDKKYTSTVYQPNKKMAEHVAALSAIHGLKIRDKLSENWGDSIE